MPPAPPSLCINFLKYSSQKPLECLRKRYISRFDVALHVAVPAFSLATKLFQRHSPFSFSFRVCPPARVSLSVERWCTRSPRSVLTNRTYERTAHIRVSSVVEKNEDPKHPFKQARLITTKSKPSRIHIKNVKRGWSEVTRRHRHHIVSLTLSPFLLGWRRPGLGRGVRLNNKFK